MTFILTHIGTNMITVGHVWNPGAIFIGRGSSLGNPFKMNDEGERDYVCDKYEKWFNEKIASKDTDVLNELRHILIIAKKAGCNIRVLL